MPSPHKNSGNEYFVVTEPNAALTDTAGWWGNWWGKQETEPPAQKSENHKLETEPPAQQSENHKLEQEVRQLNEENNGLKKTINYLKEENRHYVEKVINYPKLVKDNERLKIHIYYFLKAVEEKKTKHAILDRCEGMKTVLKQQYAAQESKVTGVKFSQDFMEEMHKLNQFMQKPQFDDDDEIIQDMVQIIKAQIGL
jgi:hypothetical protein